MSVKKTSDNMALVDVQHQWKPIDPKNPPPSGVKLLLIDKKLGIAVIGIYTKEIGWTHYAGLPTFDRQEKT